MTEITEGLCFRCSRDRPGVFAVPPVDGRDGVYRSIDLKGNTADDRSIDDGVDRLGLVVGAFWFAANAGAGSWYGGKGHGGRAPIGFDAPTLWSLWYLL